MWCHFVVFKMLLKRVFRFFHKMDCLGFFRASKAMLAWVAVPNAHLSKCVLQFVSGTARYLLVRF